MNPHEHPDDRPDRGSDPTVIGAYAVVVVLLLVGAILGLARLF